MLTSKELRRVAAMEQTYPRDPNPCFGAPPDLVKAARYRADQEALKRKLEHLRSPKKPKPRKSKFRSRRSDP